MSRTDLTVEQRFKQAILDLRVCSDARTANLNGGHGGGKPGAVNLLGGDIGEADAQINAYRFCSDDQCRLDVTVETEGIVEKRRRLDPADRPQGETPDEERARILKDTAKWSPEDVAKSSHAIPAKIIRRWRREAELNEETGLSATAVKIDPEALVIDLFERNVCRSQNEIARRVGLHHTKVSNIIRRHQENQAA